MSSLASPAFCTPVAIPSCSPSGALISSRHLSPVVVPRRVSRRTVVAVVGLRDEDTKIKERDEAELQSFVDPSPEPYAFFAEQANGRAAMIGFFAALVIEVTSGVPINQQIRLLVEGLGKQGFLMLSPFIELISRSLVH